MAVTRKTGTELFLSLRTAWKAAVPPALFHQDPEWCSLPSSSAPGPVAYSSPN